MYKTNVLIHTRVVLLRLMDAPVSMRQLLRRDIPCILIMWHVITGMALSATHSFSHNKFSVGGVA